MEAIKARVREMEEEAEKLKEMQNEVDKQMNLSSPPPAQAAAHLSLEEKGEVDARSVYVGNVRSNPQNIFLLCGLIKFST